MKGIKKYPFYLFLFKREKIESETARSCLGSKETEIEKLKIEITSLNKTTDKNSEKDLILNKYIIYIVFKFLIVGKVIYVKI